VAESESFRTLRAKIISPDQEVLRADANLNSHIRRSLLTCTHMSGTCRMGPERDEEAVVDQYGRVRGVDHLRVVDTSIWPQPIRRSANATAIMTGERAAALWTV
jgi:choline dehydrogenase